MPRISKRYYVYASAGSTNPTIQSSFDNLRAALDEAFRIMSYRPRMLWIENDSGVILLGFDEIAAHKRAALENGSHLRQDD